MKQTRTDRALVKLLNAVTDAVDEGATVKSVLEAVIEGFENSGYMNAARTLSGIAKAFEGVDH